MQPKWRQVDLTPDPAASTQRFDLGTRDVELGAKLLGLSAVVWDMCAGVGNLEAKHSVYVDARIRPM